MLHPDTANLLLDPFTIQASYPAEDKGGNKKVKANLICFVSSRKVKTVTLIKVFGVHSCGNV